MRAWANSCAFALTLPSRLLMVLKASLTLFLVRVLGTLMEPLLCSQDEVPTLRPSQLLFGWNLYGGGGFEDWRWSLLSEGSADTEYSCSSLNVGNLSSGLLMGSAFAVTCNSGCREEDRRRVPVTMVVVMTETRSCSVQFCSAGAKGLV